MIFYLYFVVLKKRKVHVPLLLTCPPELWSVNVTTTKKEIYETVGHKPGDHEVHGPTRLVLLLRLVTLVHTFPASSFILYVPFLKIKFKNIILSSFRPNNVSQLTSTDLKKRNNFF